MNSQGVRSGPGEVPMTDMIGRIRFSVAGIAGALSLISMPINAQGVETFDPDGAYSGEIDGDLVPQTGGSVPAEPAAQVTTAAAAPATQSASSPAVAPTWSDPGTTAQGGEADQDARVVVSTEDQTTYAKDDLIGEAEGVFGKGAEGLARMIEDLLDKQGEPNAYIVGREAGGAFVVGARYGSGTLHHKIEGERQVYWTGPSVGFDAGANAANTFVLVYNLYDSEELYERYPAGEGQAYLVGGLHASYLRKGDVVLIPIRMGAGLRLGVNAGYMKFSKKQRWLPF